MTNFNKCLVRSVGREPDLHAGGCTVPTTGYFTQGLKITVEKVLLLKLHLQMVRTSCGFESHV